VEYAVGQIVISSKDGMNEDCQGISETGGEKN
jgi:hypothetical protein